MHGTSKKFSVNQALETCRLVSENARVIQYLRGRFIFEVTADQVGMRLWSSESELWLREYFEDAVGVEDIVTPLVDIHGDFVAVRVWPVPREEGRDLTRLAMRGRGEGKGLLMASGLALAWLRGEAEPEVLVVAEGEPDYLTCVQLWGSRDGVAVVGIVAGSWTAAHGAKVPDGCRVILRCDDDPVAAHQKYSPGEVYARAVYFSLGGRCEVWRYADPEGEHRDQNDLLRAGLAPVLDLLWGCAPYCPEPDPEPPPAPAPEPGSERGRVDAEDASGWLIARAALAWISTWEKCLSFAQGPGGTHGKGGWAAFAYTCFRAAAGLQERRHKVSVAQLEAVEGAAGALARLEPKAMEEELRAAAKVGAGKDEATERNRDEKVTNCLEDGVAKALDMDGLTKHMDTRPPELKPKKEKEKKEKKEKKQKETKLIKTPPPALRIVRPDEITPQAPEAQDTSEEEDELEDFRRSFPPLPQVRDEKWKDDLALTRDGETKGTLRNIDLILSNDPRCAATIRLNDFLGRLEIFGSPEWATQTEGGGHRAAIPDGSPVEDDHVSGICVWIGKEYGADLDRGKALDAMRLAGRRHKYDPLSDYLNGLVWDGVERLDGWLEKYCAVKMELDIAAFAGRKWMVSAVARALDPGCQADYSIVLEGNWGRSNQGSGKSQALYALCPNPEWHLVFDFDPGSKEALENMRGKWLIELAELAILSRGRDARIIKGFLTKMTDRYRASYGMLSKDHRRRSVFFGTVNPEGAGDYLTDPTGNRRWWPVRCGGKVDVVGIRRDRDQLWAEAVARYRRGEIYYPTEAENERLEDARELRTAKDTWAYPLVTWLSETTRNEIPISDVLDLALHLEVSRQTKADQMRASNVLRAAGWTAKLKGKYRISVWCRPEPEPVAQERGPTQLTLGSAARPDVAPALDVLPEDDDSHCPF